MSKRCRAAALQMCFPSIFLRQWSEQFVEVRGDRLAQGEEPDHGFVLLAILAVGRPIPSRSPLRLGWTP